MTFESPTGGKIALGGDSNVTINGLNVGLKGGEAMVAGKNYGTVKTGDAVKIEASGKVLVNGVEREPLP